jgi:hypothetical protein
MPPSAIIEGDAPIARAPPDVTYSQAKICKARPLRQAWSAGFRRLRLYQGCIIPRDYRISRRYIFFQLPLCSKA